MIFSLDALIAFMLACAIMLAGFYAFTATSEKIAGLQGSAALQARAISLADYFVKKGLDEKLLWNGETARMLTPDGQVVKSAGIGGTYKACIRRLLNSGVLEVCVSA